MRHEAAKLGCNAIKAMVRRQRGKHGGALHLRRASESIQHEEDEGIRVHSIPFSHGCIIKARVYSLAG